jgi:hypothetical protein
MHALVFGDQLHIHPQQRLVVLDGLEGAALKGGGLVGPLGIM